MENKKTDGVSVQEKNQAWSKITAKFNAACLEGRHRTMDSLKKLFDNKKRELRKPKAEILKTGGGPSQRTGNTSQDLLFSIVDPLTVVGGTTSYGSGSRFLLYEKNQDPLEYEVKAIEHVGPNEHQKENEMNMFDDQVITESSQLMEDGNQGNNFRSMEQLADISRGWKKGSDLEKPVSARLRRSISKPAQSDKAESQASKRANTCKPSNRRRPTETVIR
ncbi:unnamed protein product [Acanthoscelides obtectus]|uniref:Regulatory protein zeste n=1 Tax=Acanthoscelides obtectus TaxID=200917 RepID=A0A9P0KEB0_ACAOB|nr:unnamed protein product [Acanthoscelides obtectus]CAK1633537.1 hypothetical protein AOBTE_LOCUS8207 [Acanthoscelides obtectus]